MIPLQEDSRERFLAQLVRCVAHQPDGITAPEVPRSGPEEFNPSRGDILPEDVTGNGAPCVPCAVEFPSGLGAPPSRVSYYDGNWA